MDFALRPMERADSPAIAALLSTEATTTALGMTTRYRHDIYASLVAQHPTMFGVVATTDGFEGLVGLATAFLDEVRVEGRTYTCARLENLKVHHDFRRQGLGRRLADWRIAEARRRFGDDGVGVITAGIDATNAASLATASHWATQLMGPLRIHIATTTSRPARGGGALIAPMQDRDVEAVVGGMNAFYANHNLFPIQTAATLAAAHAPSPLLGAPIRHYRVARSPGGAIVAGASVTERFALMADHLERVPRPLAILSKVLSLVPPDGVIRSIEVGLAWHAPGHASAGRQLWEAIRREWSDRATHVAGIATPGSELAAMFHLGPSFQPRVRLMVPVQSPEPLDATRPIYLWR